MPFSDSSKGTQLGPLRPNSLIQKVSPMLSTHQLDLKVCTAYITWVEELYADNPHEADRLLLVLKIYQWQLRRSANPKPVNPDQMATLKHGVRQAEILMEDIHENESEDMKDWYLGCKENNQAQRLVNLLWEIVMSLTAEIQENEALYPALKPMFDRERAAYRRMKEAADEAMSLD